MPVRSRLGLGLGLGLVLALTVAGGCGSFDPCSNQAGNCLGLVFEGKVGKIDMVHVDVSGAWEQRVDLPLPQGVEPPVGSALLFPQGLSGTAQVHVNARLADQVVAIGNATADLVSDGRVRLVVTLVAAAGASCVDETLDGEETDIDCGGSSCAPCSNGRTCAEPSDCASGVCTYGRCLAACPTGQVVCDGRCVDPMTNRDFCGATEGCGEDDASTPGTACPAGQLCVAGECVLDCPTLPPTEMACPTEAPTFCTDTSTDSNNCGACGTICSNGRYCSSGICKCPGLLAFCGGACVDGQSNHAFCGATSEDGTTCVGAEGCDASHICSGGSCTLTCQTGLEDCGGVCKDLNSDPNNCGACGTHCSDEVPVGGHAITYCDGSGHCQWYCESGWADCQGAATDGCETHVAEDNTNCGVCGNVCGATQTCLNGICTAA